ncbi:MAG: hypothetical protein ACRD3L_08510 [Terriglobales bacterium]
MDRTKHPVALLVLFLMGVAAAAQEPPSAPASDLITVRGCLEGQRGNYILVENNATAVYVLKGVGNKLDRQLHSVVEVKGKLLPGSIKTGVRAEKAGSNPSDTVHGVDGVPLQVANVAADVRTISKHCKAADQQ